MASPAVNQDFPGAGYVLVDRVPSSGANSIGTVEPARLSLAEGLESGRR